MTNNYFCPPSDVTIYSFFMNTHLIIIVYYMSADSVKNFQKTSMNIPMRKVCFLTVILNTEAHWCALFETNQAHLDLLFHTLMIIWLAVFNIILLGCHSSLETWLWNLA